MSQSHTTTDHDEIRRWAEQRNGRPARVPGTGKKGDAGLLRIDFREGDPDPGDDSLEELSWDEFFEKFEEKKLALLYQDKTAAGKPSTFNKLVSR